MDAEPLYSAEQIKVPAVLPDVLKQWTKAVIRENPSDVVGFSAEYDVEEFARVSVSVETTILRRYFTKLAAKND